MIFFSIHVHCVHRVLIGACDAGVPNPCCDGCCDGAVVVLWLCATVCPCPSCADWCLRSDAIPDHILRQARLDLAELGLINQRPVDHVLDLAPQGTLNIQIEFIDDQTLFGLDLTSVISREASADGVPHLVKEAIRHVELDDGLETSGIYRVPGSLSAVKALKNTFCDDPLTSLAPALPQNDVCSFLKLYFREMPEPLFTNVFLTWA